MAKRSRSYAHLVGMEDHANGIPVTNGTRANGGRKPRTRGKASPCISYNLNDPTNITVFEPTHKAHGTRLKKARVVQVRDTRPEVLRLVNIIGNIGNVE